MKTVWNVVMTGALAVGVLSTAALPALAATDSDTKAKVEEVMESLRTKLEAIGVELPEKKSPFDGLDEATKAQAESILEQKKAGELTEEEAEAQLDELGVELPMKEKGAHHLEEAVAAAGLDEAAQTKADDVMAQLEAGTITHDEAKEQLKALGVTLPVKGLDHLKEAVAAAGLDEAAQTKADDVMAQLEAGTITHDEAKEQLKALGVTLLERMDPFANLDEETKAKAEAIMDQMKNGDLTHDEAKEQLEALGVTIPERGGRGGHGRHHGGNMLQGLDEETQQQAEALMEDAEQQLEDLGVEKELIH